MKTISLFALTIAVTVSCAVGSTAPQFSCLVVSVTNQNWHVKVTVTGPTPDINGGAKIMHLAIGYYDAPGDEVGTGWGMNGLHGFSVAAGQSLTYPDVADGTGQAPNTCVVQSY